MDATATGRTSLSERTILAGREVFLGRRRGPLTMLPFAGPAVIASIAYMDPGNFATNIQAGAGYGYELLWVALSANLVAMLFQALSAKIGIASGRNLAELCREHFAPPVVCSLWLASEIAAMGDRASVPSLKQRYSLAGAQRVPVWQHRIATRLAETATQRSS